jgi:hypothetical protein
MSDVQAPKSIPDLLKLIAKYGKRSAFVSGVRVGAPMHLSASDH